MSPKQQLAGEGAAADSVAAARAAERMRMLAEDILGLTDFTYEAALDPALWPLVLARSAEVFSSRSVALFGMEPRSGELRFELMHGVPHAERDPMRERLLRLGFAGALATGDAPAVLAYDGTAAPAPAGSRVPVLPSPAGPHYLAARLNGGDDLTVVAALRREAFDPSILRAVERYAPHLERALQVGRRMCVLDAQNLAAGDAIDRLPLGVFMLSESGEVTFMNRAAHDILNDGEGLCIRRGVLRATRKRDDNDLLALIRGAVERPAGQGEAVLAIRRRAPRRCLNVVVTPVRAAQGSPFGSGARMLAAFVSDPDTRYLPAQAVLQRLYDLTDTEARVAALLAGGYTLDETAEQLGVARGTVRVHLERVFRKTGTHRQAELIRVLLTSPIVLG